MIVQSRIYSSNIGKFYTYPYLFAEVYTFLTNRKLLFIHSRPIPISMSKASLYSYAEKQPCMVTFLYNLYIFIWIQHGCFFLLLAFDPSNSVIKRLWCTFLWRYKKTISNFGWENASGALNYINYEKSAMANKKLHISETQTFSIQTMNKCGGWSVVMLIFYFLFKDCFYHEWLWYDLLLCH